MKSPPMRLCRARPLYSAVMVFAFSLLLLLAVVSSVKSAEVVRVAVARAGSTFTISAELLVKAPPKRVQRLLTDYAHLGRLNSSIQESVVLERGDKRNALVRIVIRTCLMFFCVDTTQVQVFVVLSGKLLATIVPEHSDFRFGWVHWRFVPEGVGTRVHLDAELQPDFWIPPLIGTFLIKRQVRKQVLETFEAIENQELPKLGWTG